MTQSTLEASARQHALKVVGTCQTEPDDNLGPGTIILLGPDEPSFWSLFRDSPEFADQRPNPMDRWSERVITKIARQMGGRALFPFGNPARPFLTWALRSGECWSSPVGLLVHRTQGLLVSFRGAVLSEDHPLQTASGTSPCQACNPRPCVVACPVGALSATGYDLQSCHSHLDTPDGTACMAEGCAVRMACPVSQNASRPKEQSAFHMQSFHPKDA